MSTLSLSVNNPAPLTQIPQSRQITVSGSFALSPSPGHTVTGRRVSAIFGAGPSISGSVTGGTWTVSGSLPASIGPNTNFDVVVSGSAMLRYNIVPGEPDIEDVSAHATITLRSPLPRAPNLAINPIATSIVTDSLPVDLRFSGTASGVDAPMLVVQYLVDGGVPGQAFPSVQMDSPGYANWSMTLPVPPGQHTFMARGMDLYLTGTGERSVTVNVQRQNPVPSGKRTTLGGEPTTASITSWTRLEPRMNATDLGASSGARVFDPLWMLTRQWQMGEFQGEDAGSPALARVRSTNARLTRVQAGTTPTAAAAGRPYDAMRVPLETMVERRRMRAADQNDPRMLCFAIDAGLHFARMLEAKGMPAAYRTAFLSKFQLLDVTPGAGTIVDDATARYVQSMVNRAPDGRRLAQILRIGIAGLSTLDVALSIADADKAKVHEIATAWLAWYDSVFSEPTGDDAWNPSRLEYQMSVGTRLSAAAADEITLAASEIDGSPLDWSSFDIANGTSLGTASDSCFSQAVEATVPAPVSFAGLPAPRFWEMEDSRIAYGLMPVGPTDIAQLLMVEYASSYGNDWFIIPMTLPVGSVTRVDSLVVTDTFGMRNLIRPIGDPALPAPFFSMWQLTNMYPGTGPKTASNRFFLPPTLPRTLDSGPLEEVRLMRDEMANVAWAIERMVESPLERSAIRDEADGGTPPAPPSTTTPRYVLSTTVPTNWIPLIPVQPDPTTANPQLSRLRRGRVLQANAAPSRAVGDLLNSSAELLLYEEEVPREGVRLTRQRRMARWIDGSTWVWTSFRNEVGRGEGSSGIEFDQVTGPLTGESTAGPPASG